MITEKTVSIVGSTGTIGKQALEVADALGYKVCALSCGGNVELLERQIRRYRPKVAAVMDEKAAAGLRISVADTDTRVLSGMEGLCETAAQPEADITLTAVVGMVGLLPTLSAIRAGKTVALANKETLVAGGSVVMPEAERRGVSVLPVDSEHCAIHQCLEGCARPKEEVEKLILTASGGPFRGKKRHSLHRVSAADALKHPVWSMGSKITVDSATLMNKGLEVMEAMWLFDMPLSRIEVAVHPQSVIHSMVEFVDRSVLAQLGTADMRLPIQYALTHPDRVGSLTRPLDIFGMGPLTFERPDLETFGCLRLALSAARTGGTMPAVLNAVNEEAVALFLQGKLPFLGIEEEIDAAMQAHTAVSGPTVEEILEADAWARRFTLGRNRVYNQ